MKTLYIIPILAFVLAVAGCASGGTEPAIAVTEEPTPALTEAPPAEVVAPLEVIIVKTDANESAPKDVRIDAVSFLGALVKSGCEIDRAEYKEVIRGGGIIVTCKGSIDALETEGLEGL